eukprot:152935-Pyramimonas_sp.AAC.2
MHARATFLGPHSRRCFGWTIHHIRGDASNSAIALSYKAHNCEVSSRFHYPVELIQNACSSGEVMHIPQVPSSCSALYSDVQRVPLSCGAIEQRAMYLKQCKLLGAQTWEEVDSDSEPDSPDDPSHETSQRYFHLRIYVVGSDQGGDQKGSHKYMLQDCKGRRQVWYWRHWCMRHVVHLISQKQLARHGKQYWSTLAKT